MAEFTQKQVDQIDRVENAAYELCKALLDNDDLAWDISMIGEVADSATEILVGMGWRVWYPAIVNPNPGMDDDEYVQDYIEPDKNS